MKAAAIEPAVAFPRSGHAPDEHDLETALGQAFAPIAEITAKLREAVPGAIATWHYSDRSGWYRIAAFKQRRLFYLVPRHGDFRLSLIVGARAIASLAGTPQAATIANLLKSAKYYPEGTAISFDRTNCDADLVIALLAAKLAH